MKATRMISRIGNDTADTDKKDTDGARLFVNRRRSRRPFVNGEPGMTLIEVMLAVTVLSMGIVGVLRAYAGSVATLEGGQFNIDAVNLLKQKMSEVREEILDRGPDMPERDNGNFEGPWRDFLWSWRISPTETEYLNELELNVSHNNNPRVFSIKTYVLDPPDEEEE